MRHRLAVALVAVLVGVAPLQAQDGDAEPETYARRGMIIGAATGGVLSGLGLGVLAAGLCESGQGCDGAFRDGFAVGFVAGGVVGGLAGLVVGAGIRRADSPEQADSVRTPPGPWRLRLSAGPRWSAAGPLGRSGPWVGVSLMRPTSPSIRFGMEVAYLAAHERSRTFSVTARDGTETLVRQSADRTLWNVSLVAARRLGSRDGTGPYLMANAGVYPLREDATVGPVEPDGTSEILSSARSDVEAYPGIGVGAGGAWRLGDRLSFGVEGRLHLVVALGDDLGLPLATLGGSLGMSF